MPWLECRETKDWHIQMSLLEQKLMPLPRSRGAGPRKSNVCIHKAAATLTAPVRLKIALQWGVSLFANGLLAKATGYYLSSIQLLWNCQDTCPMHIHPLHISILMLHATVHPNCPGSANLAFSLLRTLFNSADVNDHCKAICVSWLDTKQKWPNAHILGISVQTIWGQDHFVGQIPLTEHQSILVPNYMKGLIFCLHNNPLKFKILPLS